MGLQYLKKKRMFPLWYVIKLAVLNVFYKQDWISEEQMARLMLTYYRDKRLVDFERSADEFYYTCLQPHLAPKILERVLYHKEEGHLLILVSGSIRYWLKPVMEDLGFNFLLCTDLEEGEDGLLTGRPEGTICVDTHKRERILDLVSRKQIDLRQSYAYGNHQADIPMLTLVGHPYAVEPSPRLKITALQNSWPILSYR